MVEDDSYQDYISSLPTFIFAYLFKLEIRSGFRCELYTCIFILLNK